MLANFPDAASGAIIRYGHNQKAPNRRLQAKTIRTVLDRRLEDDPVPKEALVSNRLTNEQFMKSVNDYMKQLASENFPSGEVRDTNGRTYVINGPDTMYKFKCEQGKEDEVKCEFKNDVVSSEFMLEKTRVVDFVKAKIKLYVGGYVLLVKQTVLSIRNIYSDLEQVASYSCENIYGKTDLAAVDYDNGAKELEKQREAEKGERRLTDEQPSQYTFTPKDAKQDRILNDDLRISKDFDWVPQPHKLKYKPVYSHITMFDLDLKNKTYISKKKKVRDFIRRTLPKIVQNSNTRERSLEGGEDDAPEASGDAKQMLRDKGIEIIGKNDPFYTNPKAIVYGPGILQSKEIMILAFKKGSMPVGNVYRFTLIPSRTNLEDVHCELHIIKGKMVTVIFQSTTFTSVLNISIPTSRFILKHIRLEFENIERLLQIVDNLDYLREWIDNTEHNSPQQYSILENVQPNVIYMMLRADMDNLSDGQTAAPTMEEGTTLAYSHSENDDMTKWFVDANQIDKGMRTLVIHMLMTFTTLGPDFEVFDLAAQVNFKGTKIWLGVRKFPDYSMYNQHFLCKRYLDLIAEITINSTPSFQSYKEIITPFAVSAFRYTSAENIPKLDFPETMEEYNNLIDASEMVDSLPLEVNEDGVMIELKLCSVRSQEFVDYIRLGRGGYSFLDRDIYLRPDIDICHVITRPNIAQDDDSAEGLEGEGNDDKNERRLLQVLKAEGELV